ncbi:short-chain dehydrogenase [Thozetella sp. PMI_491]|nr:short-chain dehydrogenase [Thozetella sp. PMI_491]
MSSSSYTTIVLITGANQGIGFEIAKKLGTDHPDYHIILAGRRQNAVYEAVAKIQNLGASIEGLILDVTSDQSISNAAQIVARTHGRLDVLINNAGISRFDGARRPRDLWHSIFDTNVFGAQLVTEAFLPLLQQSQTTKRIVNMTSSLGSLALRQDPSSEDYHVNEFMEYSASKTALHMVTMYYARQFDQDPSWKINLCSPGFCATNHNQYSALEPPELGAINACRLATLGPDGETATCSSRHGPLPW